MLPSLDPVKDKDDSHRQYPGGLPFVLSLPLEIRERIYHKVLPTSTCLRIDHLEDRPNSTRGIRLQSDGPLVDLSYCTLSHHRNAENRLVACDCLFWQGKYPLKEGILWTSRAVQADALAFVFRENTLAVGHNIYRGGLKHYPHLLGPWTGEVRSILLKESIYNARRQIDPIGREDILRLAEGFSTVTSVLVCVTICGWAHQALKFDEEYILRLFRVLAEWKLQKVDVELSRSGNYTSMRSDLVYLRDLERRCLEELETTRLAES